MASKVHLNRYNEWWVGKWRGTDCGRLYTCEKKISQMRIARSMTIDQQQSYGWYHLSSYFQKGIAWFLLAEKLFLNFQALYWHIKKEAANCFRFARDQMRLKDVGYQRSKGIPLCRTGGAISIHLCTPYNVQCSSLLIFNHRSFGAKIWC